MDGQNKSSSWRVPAYQLPQEVSLVFLPLFSGPRANRHAISHEGTVQTHPNMVQHGRLTNNFDAQYPISALPGQGCITTSPGSICHIRKRFLISASSVPIRNPSTCLRRSCTRGISIPPCRTHSWRFSPRRTSCTCSLPKISTASSALPASRQN